MKTGYASQVGVEPTTTKYATLGELVMLGATGADMQLMVITTSSGAWAGGMNYEADTSSETVVNHVADSGPLILRYVYNSSGSTIGHGEHVAYDISSGPAHVVQGTAALTPAGVTLCDIPTLCYGWVVVQGYVERLLCDGSVTVDTRLEPANSGKATDVAASTDGGSFAQAAATDAGDGTFVAARVFCQL